MYRAPKLFLAVVCLALGACEVKVTPTSTPVIVEKRTTIVEHEKPPIIVHVDEK